MSMVFFTQHAAVLRNYLHTFFTETGVRFLPAGSWGTDVSNRLGDYTSGGKLIRGALVALGYRIAGSGTAENGSFPDKVLAVGAAMELLQSAFLVHDDIMDQDTLRRGKPAIHWQYCKHGEQLGVADPLHYGEAMGICAGDVAFFLAVELLSRPGIPQELMNYCAREVAAVGLAQMQDVTFGSTSSTPAEDELIRLYTWKTGRYSFSMPLALGSLLAGANPALVSQLEKIGQEMGIAFQMRDDELGIFGDEEELGKPVGSDIREGKKTLLICLASERLEPQGRQRMHAILGNSRATGEDIAELRTLIETCGARSELTQRMDDACSNASSGIKGLDCTADCRSILSNLLDFVVSRRK